VGLSDRDRCQSDFGRGGLRRVARPRSGFCQPRSYFGRGVRSPSSTGMCSCAASTT